MGFQILLPRAAAFRTPAGDSTLTFHQDFTQSSLANAAIVGPTLTFARATSATYFDSSAVLQTASSGTARVAAHIYNGGSAVNKGVLVEEAATNLMLWNRDWTDAVYTATNITAAKDATGLDNSANAASSLTASAGNGTIFQTITLTSAARTSSVYVKRKTGTGTIEFSDDGGSTYTDITSSLSSSVWFRTSKTTTQANPSIGFRITTSGDAIEVDYGQCEARSFITSPIATTTASVTRNADVLGFPTDTSAWWDDDTATHFTEAYFLAGTDNTSREIWQFELDSPNPKWEVVSSGNSQITWSDLSLSGGSITSETDVKIAWAFDAGVPEAAQYINGSAAGTDISFTLAAMNGNNLYWHDSGGSGTNFNGFMKTYKAYNVRKNNTFLASETS